MNVRNNSDGYVRISVFSQKDEVMGSEGRLIKFDMKHHIRRFYNLHPMLRHRCKFVRYKKVAWVIEMDTSKDTPVA